MVIAVAGDVDTERVVASIKKHFSGFNGAELKLPKVSAEKPAGSIRQSTVSQKDKTT